MVWRFLVPHERVRSSRRALRLSAVVLACSAFLSCKDAAPTSQSGIWGQMQILRVSDQIDNIDTTYASALAQFYQNGDQTQPIQAGIVLCNGRSLPFDPLYQKYTTDTLPLLPDYDEWAVGGSSAIPSFTLRVPAVLPVKVTSLKANDTLRRTQPFVLKWAPAVPGQPIDVEVDDTSGTIYSLALTDNGSGFVDLSTASAFHPGPGFVYVFRPQHATGQVGDKFFTAQSQAVSRVKVVLAGP